MLNVINAMLPDVLAAYGLPAGHVSVTPLAGGHINDTLRVSAGTQDYVLQRLNTEVFRAPLAVCRNIDAVCARLAEELADVPDRTRRMLTPVAGRDGQNWQVDAGGNYWRLWHYVTGSRSQEVVDSPALAEAGGRAFGRFLRQLSSLDPATLADTIPYFHDAARRRAALAQAEAAAPADRRAAAAEPLAAAAAFAWIPDHLQALQAEGLPLRVTHNDTKISNVLFDRHTGEALCVIDLDTVMPGTVLYDYGDMVRSFVSPVGEDHPDLDQIAVDPARLEALHRGFMAEAGDFLTPLERRELYFGGQLMTYIMGVRFLTDYLAGNVYYKVAYPTHNLVRARNQFRLLDLLTAQAGAWQGKI
ncbi:MAG: aminoglycoside phosphotransferase family protein [Bacteroidetes bacterium]|nr:MAG: aminoglycoside phosphotransferase family protein [Bacteroidota bacterium]